MRLSVGRYVPFNSIIHRMDPRIKLFCLILLIACIFIRTGFTGYALLSAVIFLIYFTAKLKIGVLGRILKPILFMVVVLFIVNCFLIKPGNGVNIGAHVGTSWFVLSEAAAYQSLYLGIRIYLMITVTTILTSTTQPLDLTLAIEDLLTPLKLIRFPVHILSTIISIALRMIPTLIDEAGRIMKAQASRGIDFANGKLKDKVKSTVSLIIPLLVSAFQKAEDLAYAMDARGYDPKSTRSRYRQYKIKLFDLFCLLLTAGVVTAIIWYSQTPYLPASVNVIHYLDTFVHG